MDELRSESSLGYLRQVIEQNAATSAAEHKRLRETLDRLMDTVNEIQHEMHTTLRDDYVSKDQLETVKRDWHATVVDVGRLWLVVHGFVALVMIGFVTGLLALLWRGQ